LIKLFIVTILSAMWHCCYVDVVHVDCRMS